MSEPGSDIPGAATEAKARRRAAFRLPPFAPWLRRLGWRGSDIATTLRESFEHELQERAGVPWLAVAFAAGSAGYFVLPREPLLSALVLTMAVLTITAAVTYARGTSWRVVTVLAVLIAGATVAKLRVDHLDTPQIERDVFAELSGRVVASDSGGAARPRIVLDDLNAKALPGTALPRRIRLTLAARYGLPPLGARISLRGRLMPVAGPVVPGGYDAHRAAFFDGIGGTGFALGGWSLEPSGQPFSLSLAIARVRSSIVQRIVSVEPGEAGALAAALLVGDRSGLSETTKDNLRISGLAHILAISGLHMMLIAGTAFFFIRALLALSPRLALTFPIRKWAALAALVVVSLYFVLSGGGAATVRAYVMAAIVFTAILLDRPAVSMRNLAIAAFVVVALQPESVMEPGFQMSFAAVAALIATWEFWRNRQVRRLADNSALPGMRVLRTAWRVAVGVAITSLVAGLATAPFAAYHFERVATYSLLANLLAAPLVSGVIMPFGLCALVVMPFGLEVYPLHVMGSGIDGLLAIAAWVASLPGAQVRAPAIAPAALILIVVGMLWVCLWRLRWRWLGAPVIGLGLVLIPILINPPDILVAPDGKAVAVRDAGGTLRVSGARAGSYAVDQFFQKERALPPDGAALRAGIRCDTRACLLSAAANTEVSHVLDPAAFLEDCARASVIVTALQAPADCRAPLVIDAARLKTFGAHAVWIGSDNGTPAFKVTTERSGTPRPWQAVGGE
jgi:competence protein ComEC